MTKEERISELEGKIVAVCLQCPHAKFSGGWWTCKVSRRHCHSKRVSRWLAEIKRLEAKVITEEQLAIIEDKEFQERNCSDCRFADPDNLGNTQWCTYHGELQIENGLCVVREPCQHCFACGICIGPFYLEGYPFAVGDKILCGHCHSRLQGLGYLPLDAYINVDRVRKLMPDGSVWKPPWGQDKRSDNGTREG